jgi:hypothetical protein
VDGPQQRPGIGRVVDHVEGRDEVIALGKALDHVAYPKARPVAESGLSGPMLRRHHDRLIDVVVDDQAGGKRPGEGDGCPTPTAADVGDGGPSPQRDQDIGHGG